MIDGVTNREYEILILVSGGYNSKEIGKRLFITEDTVNTHRKKLLLKLNAANSAELVRMAFEKGLITI